MRVIKIKDCSECPYCHLSYFDFGNYAFCRKIESMLNKYPIIPDNCSLCIEETK